ncbi:hypothetical protein GTNG_2625 [Geobacillus thermodenitrificans NG80-2]|uniref:Uncharacterized protein n=1 Tax=Geobacillus thermodenitrificans (strain NG80-2) TaxID=420246 RepID=A4IRL6_GEOTN|nr:hypothetical protein GTNG_2625 [Geobacillus thermodenitrificans NG80-2]
MNHNPMIEIASETTFILFVALKKLIFSLPPQVNTIPFCLSAMRKMDRTAHETSQTSPRSWSIKSKRSVSTNRLWHIHECPEKIVWKMGRRNRKVNFSRCIYVDSSESNNHIQYITKHISSISSLMSIQKSMYIRQLEAVIQHIDVG